MGCNQAKVVNKRKDPSSNTAVRSEIPSQEPVESKRSLKFHSEAGDSSNEVKIKIPKNEGTWEKSYKLTTPLKDIVEDFKKDNGDIHGLGNEIVWKVNGSNVDLTSALKTIVPSTKNIDLDISYEIQGLSNLPIVLSSGSSAKGDLVGKPLTNPFEVFVFNKREHIFQSLEFDENAISQAEINLYSRFSAYCNGDDKLFISGGENENGVILGHFWVVDLRTNKIEKIPGGTRPKKLHSLFYLDDYVFIVGGNTKDVFVYNVLTSNFEEFSQLNKERVEPAISIVDNKYIYVMDNLRINREGSKISFERANLRNSPKWELIHPNLDQSIRPLELQQKFFGVTNLDENNLILLGGVMDTSEGKLENPRNFIYDHKNNLVKKSNIKFEEIDLAEKTFYPITSNADFVVPYFNRGDAKIILFNKQNKKLIPIHFEPSMNTPMAIEQYLDDNMLHSIKITQSFLPKTAKKKYNFNMPRFDEIKSSILDQPLRESQYQDGPQATRAVKDRKYVNTPTQTKLVESRTGPGIIRQRKPKEEEPEHEERIEVQPGQVEVEPEDDEENQDQVGEMNGKGLKKSRLKFEAGYTGKEGKRYVPPVGRIGTLREDEPERPDRLYESTIPRQREDNVEIGDKYINEIERRGVDMFADGKEGLNGKGSGALLRSSVIKNSKLAHIKDSKLPTVSRNQMPKSSRIGMSANFNRDNVANLKASVNAGISGRRNASRILS